MKNVFLFILTFCILIVATSCKRDKADNMDANSNSQSSESGNQSPNDDRHVCSYNAASEIILPTCDKGGYTLRTCICGKVSKTDMTSALGHTFSAWMASIEPTYDETGMLIRHCQNGHSETLSIPPLNETNYTIEFIDGKEDASCHTAISVYYVLNTDIYDHTADSMRKFKFKVNYTLPHTYTDSYTYSSEAHYPLCDVCETSDTSLAQAHNFVDEECTVCHYTLENLIYSEEAYGLSVSYSANEESVAVHELYTGPDKALFGKIVKGIKSFKDNDRLKSITIPDSVEYIEADAFLGCSSLKDVYYEGDWESWCKISFGKGANPMNYAENFYIRDSYGNYHNAKRIVLPDTVDTISDYAFEGFEGITELVIPKSITSIGSNIGSVFNSDVNVGNIYYGGDYNDWCGISIKSRDSNPMRFTNNFHLTNSEGEYYVPTEIIISDSVSAIGDYQFSGCSSIVRISIASPLTKIGSSAFESCDSLYEVSILESCREIGNHAFSDCPLLTKVTLTSRVFAFGESAFEKCDSLRSVYFSGDVCDWCGIEFKNAESNPMHVNKNRSSDEYVDFYFYSAANGYASVETKTITISFATESIGNYQFYGFSEVKGFIITESKSIGVEAFAYCDNLRTLIIPQAMASISNGALKDNVNVEIYYYGTHQNWLDIETDSDNDEVNTSKRYYFAEASKDVTEEYDFWGFKPDGSVAKWLWNEQEDVWYLA